MPENPGFTLDAEGRICRKPEYDWRKGWDQDLDYDRTPDSLTVYQRHPLVGQVIMAIDYGPSSLPIWGNDRTFSVERYCERELAADESADWSVVYDFQGGTSLGERNTW